MPPKKLKPEEIDAKPRQDWVLVPQGHLDLPGICRERSAHVAGLSLADDGALEAERCMSPDRIINPVALSDDGVFGPLYDLIGPSGPEAR
jgi:hypothetical protein